MEDYMDYIEINPKRMFGKPTIKNTRITVEMILEELASKKEPNEIISDHPQLTEEAIWAALSFAADAIKGERVYSVVE